MNFFLYTATLNISSVQMHMTDSSLASPWQPILYYNVEPYVRTTYYAWAAFDQMLGTSCSVRIAPITISSPPDNYANRVTAYAAYQGDDLASIVLLNTQLVNASTTDQPSVDFFITLSGYAGKTLYLSYLTADGADSHFNTTFNGISYEQSGDGTPTVVDSTDHYVTINSQGVATIPLRDSQAVIANIGSKLGSSGAISSNACAALASTSSAVGGATAGGLTSAPTAGYSVTAKLATATSSIAVGGTGVVAAQASATSVKGAAGPKATGQGYVLAAAAFGALVGGVFV